MTNCVQGEHASKQGSNLIECSAISKKKSMADMAANETFAIDDSHFDPVSDDLCAVLCAPKVLKEHAPEGTCSLKT